MYPFATPFVSVFTVVLQVSGKQKSRKQKWIKRKQKREEKKQRYNHFLGWTGKHWRTWRSRLGWTNGMFCSFLWNYLCDKLFDPFLGPNGKLRPQVINCTVAPEKLMLFLLFLNWPFSNSHGWTGSSMKWRLMRANLFKCKLICPHLMLDPVQPFEYETGLFHKCPVICIMRFRIICIGVARCLILSSL